MNKQGRTQIDGFVRKLESLSKNVSTENTKETIGSIEDIAVEIEELASEERDKFDNLSEGLQVSDRGSAIEEAADNLDSAVSSLQIIDDKSEMDDIKSNVEDAVSSLQDAKG